MPWPILEIGGYKDIVSAYKELTVRRRDKYKIIIEIINNNNKWGLCIDRGIHWYAQYLMDQGLGLVREGFSEEVRSELNLTW